MATFEDLASEVAQGVAGVEYSILVDMNGYRLDTQGSDSAAGTVDRMLLLSGELASGVAAGLYDLVLRGLKIESSFGSSMTGSESVGNLLKSAGGAQTKVGTITISGPPSEHTGGLFGQPEARVKGAFSAGAYLANVDGLSPGREIRFGDRFSVGEDADGIDRWFVVLENKVADATGTIENLPFWPAIPTGGWADNARVAPRPNSLIAPFYAYSLRGRSIEVSITGRTSDGSEVGYSARGYLANQATISNQRVESDVVTDQGTGRLTIDIQGNPASRSLSDTLAVPYRGGGVAPIFQASQYYRCNVTNPHHLDDSGATGDLVIQAEVYLPEDLRGGSGKRYIIANGRDGTPDSGSYGLYWSVTNGDFRGFINIASTVYVATVTPLIEELEKWYRVRMEYDSTAGTLQLWVVKLFDRNHRSSVIQEGTPNTSLTGTYTGGTGALTIGGSDIATNLFEGMIWVAMGEVLPSSVDDREAQMRRYLSPDTDDVLAVWHGDMSATGLTWFALGPEYDSSASPSSGFEATEQTAVPKLGHLLEGGEFLRGQYPPVPVGRSRNILMSPVGSGTSLVSDDRVYAAGPPGVPIGPILAVYDGGKSLTLDTHHTSLVDLLTATVTAGQYSTFGPYIKLGSATSREVTCDTWGVSRTHTRFSQYLNGSSAYLDLPSGVLTVQGGDNMLMFWIMLDEGLTSSVKIYDSNDVDAGMQVDYDPSVQPTGEKGKFSVSVDTDFGGGLFAIVEVLGGVADPARFLGRPVHIAIWSENLDASNIEIEVWIDGISVGTDTEQGQLATSTVGPRIGAAAGTPSNYAPMFVGEIFIDNQSNLRADQEVRERMFIDISEITAIDFDYYFSDTPDLNPTTWANHADAVGSGSITITNGAWKAPIPYGGLAGPIYWALTVALEVQGKDWTELDLNSAIAREYKERSAPMPGDASVKDLLDIIRLVEGFVVWDSAQGKWIWSDLPQISSAASQSTIRSYVLDQLEVGERRDPVWAIKVGYGRIGHVQDTLASDASKGMLADVAEPIKYIELPIPGAQAAYPLSERMETYDSGYYSKLDADLAANDLLPIISEASVVLRTKDRDWMTMLVAGSSHTLVAPEAPGGRVRGLLTSVSIVEGRRDLVWIVLPG